MGVGVIVPAAELAKRPLPNAVTLHTLREAVAAHKAQGKVPVAAGSISRFAVSVDGTETEAEIAAIKDLDPVVVLLGIKQGVSRHHASRYVFEVMARHGVQQPVIHHITFPKSSDRDEIVLRGGSEVGALLVDGLGDGVMIEAEHEVRRRPAPASWLQPLIPLSVHGGGSLSACKRALPRPSLQELNFLRTTSFGMLQGSRMRNTKTEYVSCPSCGRTLFDLQEVTEQIRQKTGHLPGVAIAVMGCIVNGPGEMADADFGYVGGAPGKPLIGADGRPARVVPIPSLLACTAPPNAGKIDLYVGKEVVAKGIPMENAVDALVDLIKSHGRWVDPPKDDDEVAGQLVGSAAH